MAFVDGQLLTATELNALAAKEDLANSTDPGKGFALVSITAAEWETGIVNPQYPVGDVRRYGVFPDAQVYAGITTTGGSKNVTAPPGTFSAGMVNQALRCRGLGANSNKITAVAVDGASLTLLNNAASDYTGNAVIGTDWEGLGSTAVIYANAVLPNIEIFWPAGLYNTGLNFTNTSSGSKMNFQPGSEFATIFHLITNGVAINSGLKMRGLITTYDRFGTIQLRDSSVEAVRIKDGTSMGLNAPRGVHLYTSTQNLEIQYLEIDGCSTVNGDAALAIDDSTNSGIRIHTAWIKDSDVHGVILSGTAIEIDNLIIDGYGAGRYTNAAVGGSTGLAQSQELCGFWSNRAPRSKVKTLRISQKAPAVVAGCGTTNLDNTVTGTGFLARRVGELVAGTGISDLVLSACGTTSGSQTVTGVGFSALHLGQPVSGSGIPSGSLVSAIASDVAMTITNKATATASVDLTFGCVVTSVALDGTSLEVSNAATATGTSSLTFSRSCALYTARVTDTDIGAGTASLTIDALIANTLTRRGISIGDRNFNANTTIVGCTFAYLTTMPATALDSGYQMISINPAVTDTTKYYGKLVRFNATYGADCLFVSAGGQVDIDFLDASKVTVSGSGTVGRVAQILGRGNIGGILLTSPGSSASGVPVVVGPSNAGPVYIGKTVLSANSLITGTAVDLTSAVDFEVGPIHSNNYRGSPAITVISASRGVVKLGQVKETSAVGWGLRFQGNTNVRIEGGLITGFAKGTTGSAAGNVRCGATNCSVTGNTTNTDLAAGQVTTDATCLNVTL